MRTASLYWLSMVFAQAFPLTAWYDPEFKDTSERPLGFSPQQLLSYVHCGLLVVAAVLFNV